MSFACPVCNGLAALAKSCPQCSGPLVDGGRADDYLGPYAPYRPIDEMKLTNGYADLAAHACVHYMWCEDCQYTASYRIKEQWT